MNAHILPAFKDIPINEIKYQNVEKFINSLVCGPKRVNNILVPMRSVFKYSHKAGYVNENLMLKVDNLPVEIPDIFPFAHDEVLQIIDATEPFYRPYMKIRFYTGMRDGEINALQWSDYMADMKPHPKFFINKAFVYGKEGKTKTKKSKRYIDCIQFVQDALQEHMQNTGDKKSGYIFLAKTGRRMSPDHFRNVVWTPALKKAGLEYRPPIQTRHTFATMMLSAGEDIGWIKNMLGHSSLQMIFTRYYAWIPDKTRADRSAFVKSIISEESEKVLDDASRMANKSNVVYLFK
jgi:integrase